MGQYWIQYSCKKRRVGWTFLSVYPTFRKC
jgi:hypothetical protein